ncbi:MAG TPA: hypothetical protein VD772_07005, partial [Anseongella sp.]|nr:hypothetical protein [Anseongella sp.]
MLKIFAKIRIIRWIKVQVLRKIPYFLNLFRKGRGGLFQGAVLLKIPANGRYSALGAPGLAGNANIAAVKDKPVMGDVYLFLRKKAEQLLF